jgi:hypothetical protein
MYLTVQVATKEKCTEEAEDLEDTLPYHSSRMIPTLCNLHERRLTASSQIYEPTESSQVERKNCPIVRPGYLTTLCKAIDLHSPPSSGVSSGEAQLQGKGKAS